jgi:hypothetical protein
MYNMSKHDHQPVTLAGLLLLAAIALIFLAVVWLIGTAFARAGTEFSFNRSPWNQEAIFAFP